MSKLYEIPRGSKIKSWGEVIIFDHVDGMYSYCYLEKDKSKLIHLSASTELVLQKDGTYKIK